MVRKGRDSRAAVILPALFAAAIAIWIVVTGGDDTDPSAKAPSVSEGSERPSEEPDDLPAASRVRPPLLVADGDTIVDLSDGSRERIATVPRSGFDLAQSFPVGGDVALHYVAECADVCTSVEHRLYVVDKSAQSAEIFVGTNVWFAPGVDRIWVTRSGGGACSVGALATDGSWGKEPTTVSCSLTVLSETALGLLAVDGEPTQGTGDSAEGSQPYTEHVLLSVDSFEETFRAAQILAVTPDAIVQTDDDELAIADIGTTETVPVPRPDAGGPPVAGAASPDGTHVVVAFAGEVNSLWSLDLRTRQWSRVPGAATNAGRRDFEFEWTAAGRLTFYAPAVSVDGGAAVEPGLLLWTPGGKALELAPVQLGGEPRAVFRVNA